MREILLSRNKIALVDDADYHYLRQFNWHASARKNLSGELQFYAARKFQKPDGEWTNIYMHRELLALDDSSCHTDHVDGDRLNNQRHNLRVCTRDENLRNRAKQRNNTSGFKGVFRHKPKKKHSLGWLAQLRHKGVQMYLGVYKTKEEAALAYNEAALKYHGEFACLNPV